MALKIIPEGVLSCVLFGKEVPNVVGVVFVLGYFSIVSGGKPLR